MTYIKGQNKIIAIENDEEITIKVIRNKDNSIEKVLVNGERFFSAQKAIENGKPLEVVAQMVFTDRRVCENYRPRVYAAPADSHLCNSDGVRFDGEDYEF